MTIKNHDHELTTDESDSYFELCGKSTVGTTVFVFCQDQKCDFREKVYLQGNIRSIAEKEKRRIQNLGKKNLL